MAHILAVDDDESILLLIRNALRKEGHEVTCCQQMTNHIKEQASSYDLILLDVMMPDTDGYTLCREIRDYVDCPILFLTAKSLEEDVDFGFSLGADDYIKKPFSIIELRARVNAHLRREQREKRSCLSASGIHFFLSAKEIYINDVKMPFTKSEYEISLFLARNHGQVFSREQIYEAVFGYDGDSDNSAITEHIKNIRRKFSSAGVTPIETVWGIGYRWESNEKKK